MIEGNSELASQVEQNALPRKRSGRRRLSRFARLRKAAQSRAAVVLTVLTALIVFGSLLAVGTVHVVTLLFVAPIAILSGAIAIWVESDSRRRLPVPACIAASLAAYCFLQSIPISPRWLETISPVAAQVWRDAFRLANKSVTTWASISVDPGASRVEALKWLCYAGVFIAAARLARENGIQRGATIVVAAGLAGGLLSLIHGLLGIEDWLGIYRPQHAHPQWAPAPLLNPNNFAGYLNLALFVGISLLFVRKPVVPRWILGLSAIILTALVVLTGSRGGVTSLVVGFGVSGVAYWAQQRRAKARGGFLFPPWIPLTTVGVAAIALALIGATDAIWRQLLDETSAKLRIAEHSTPVIRDHLWTGVGRGAFETAFAAYRREPGHHIYQYAENFVIQWVVEWGLPVAAISLVALLWTLRPTRLGFARNAVPTGIVIAVSALMLQNLVDLATEIASVGIAVAVLLGTLHGGADYFADSRERVRAARRDAPRPPVLSNVAVRTAAPSATMLGFTMAGLLVMVLAALTGIPDALDERGQLARGLTSLADKRPGDPGFDAFSGHLASALLRHPADPYIPIVGAVLTRGSGASQMAWLNQALRRDALNARTYLLLADALTTHGATKQALMELRRVALYGPDLLGEAAERAIRWTTTVDDVLLTVPDGESGIQMLNAIALRFAGSPERLAMRNELLELALRRNANDFATNLNMANILLAELGDSSGTCSGELRAICTANLQKHASIVLQQEDIGPQSTVILRAMLLANDKKYDEAEQWLADRCFLVADPGSCLATRLDYASRLPDEDRFDTAATTYASASCASPESCAAAYLRVANLIVARRGPNGALSYYERSANESPSAMAWIRVAEVALQCGRINRASSALMSAKRLGGAELAIPIEQKLLEAQQVQLLNTLGPTR